MKATDGAGHHDPVARGEEGAGLIAVRREDEIRGGAAAPAT